jgi:hypothetical protein
LEELFLENIYWKYLDNLRSKAKGNFNLFAGGGGEGGGGF